MVGTNQLVSGIVDGIEVVAKGSLANDVEHSSTCHSLTSMTPAPFKPGSLEVLIATCRALTSSTS